MSRRRKLHEASTKARVALEAVKERETVAQISKRFGVHPTQVNQWKRKLLEQAPELFERENGSTRSDLNEGLGWYFDFYDHSRKHQALEYRTPYEVFQASLASTAQRGTREPKCQLAGAILN